MKRDNGTATAIYCRVACADDNAISSQEELMRNYAKESGHNYLTVYSDNGASGANLNRPAFNAMMADVEIGKVNCVIVKDIARISRNFIQFQDWLYEMRAKGVRFISVDDGFDSEKPNNDDATDFRKIV